MDRSLTTASRALVALAGAASLAANCEPPDPPTTIQVIVELRGAGAGRVVGGARAAATSARDLLVPPTSLDCPGRCEGSYSLGPRFYVAAVASPGSTFAGWSGDCRPERDPALALVVPANSVTDTARCTARFDLVTGPDAGTTDALDATPQDTPVVDAIDAMPTDRGVEDVSTGGRACGPRASPGACTPGAPGCDIVDVSIGGDTFAPSACAVFSDGSTRCWSAGCAAAGVVAGIERARAVQRGQQFVCVVRDMQPMPVWCWGANNGAQFGQRAPTLAAAPVATSIPAGALSLGGASGLALSAPGVASVWGRNQYGQLGDGTTEATTGTQGALPHEVRVAGLRQWALEPFDGAVSCGVFEDGSVRCAGRNAGGHFGAATLTGGQSATLVAVPGITNARAVALGRRFACAVRDDAQLWCWGPANNPLMAGAGTAPTRVLDRVTRVAIANTATCALRDDGTVWCWGAGSLVGNGGSDFVPAPVAVAGLTGVRGLYAGVTTVCAWRGGSDLRCWGSELTVAGEGATTPTPVVW